MKIHQTHYSQSSYLLDSVRKNTMSESMADIQKNFRNKPAVDITISSEGIDALRERVNEFKPQSDYVNVKEVKIQNTNEVAWEHYTAMREISSLTLKDKNYDVEDIMKFIMDTYETLYNRIVKEHENGDRQVSYELTGKRSLTLEEDLAGLDEAFHMCLANLEGYITCQQTNKAFGHADTSWLFRRNNMQNKVMEQDNYNYFDENYRNTAISMMKQAREDFLALFNNTSYKKGSAIGIISNILNNDEDFLSKTRKLFY